MHIFALSHQSWLLLRLHLHVVLSLTVYVRLPLFVATAFTAGKKSSVLIYRD